MIPKGQDFEFTIQVMEFESFLPQDLSTMADTPAPTLKLITYADDPVLYGTYELSTYGATNDGVTATAEKSILTVTNESGTESTRYAVSIEGIDKEVYSTDSSTTTIASELATAIASTIPNITATHVSGTANIEIEGSVTGYDLSIIPVTSNLATTISVPAVNEVPNSLTLNTQNGFLKGTIPAVTAGAATGTSGMAVLRGDAVDGLYLKPTYQGIIQVEFTDRPAVTSIIDKVYVLPTGV